jgi:iron uptake system component EfeO
MSRRTFPSLAAAALLAAAGLAACGSDAGTADANVAVDGTKDACTPATTTAAAGRIAFELKNSSGQTSELYVKDANDKIKGEVENVGDGVTRTLTVKLAAGEYKLVCKPGEKGDGFTSPFTVTG